MLIISISVQKCVESIRCLSGLFSLTDAASPGVCSISMTWPDEGFVSVRKRVTEKT